MKSKSSSILWLLFLLTISCNPSIPEPAVDPLPQVDPLPPWTSKVPEDSVNYYFVGVSKYCETEQDARDDARRDVREQVLIYIGVNMAMSFEEKSEYDGKTSSTMDPTISIKKELKEQADGFVNKIKDIEIPTKQSDKGWKSHLLSRVERKVVQNEIEKIEKLKAALLNYEAEDLGQLYQYYNKNEDNTVIAFQTLRQIRKRLKEYSGDDESALYSRLDFSQATISNHMSEIIDTCPVKNYDDAVYKMVLGVAKDLQTNRILIKDFTLNETFTAIGFAKNWQAKVKSQLTSMDIVSISKPQNNVDVESIEGNYTIHKKYIDLNLKLTDQQGAEHFFDEEVETDWLPSGLDFTIENENVYWLDFYKETLTTNKQFTINMNNNSEIFEINDRIEITVQSQYEHPVYCTLINFCADSYVYQIIPNYYSNGKLHNNGIIEPGNERDFKYNVNDKGEEGALLIISEAPLNIEGKLIGSDKLKFKQIEKSGQDLLKELQETDDNEDILHHWTNTYIVK